MSKILQLLKTMRERGTKRALRVAKLIAERDQLASEVLREKLAADERLTGLDSSEEPI